MSSRSRRALGLAFTILLIACLCLPEVLSLNRYRPWIERQIVAAVGGEVSIGHLAWGLSKGAWLEIKAFSLTGAKLPVDLSASRFRVSIALRPLLQRRIVISELGFDGPAVTLHLRPPEPIETEPSPADSEGSSTSFSVELEQLEIRAGEFILKDQLSRPGQTIDTRLDRIDLDIRNLVPGNTVTIQASGQLVGAATADGGHVSARASLVGMEQGFQWRNPQLELMASLDRIALDGLDRYVGDAALRQALGGHISAQLTYRGGLGDSGALAADVDLGQVEFHDPALSATPLPGAPLRLMTKVTIVDYQLSVDMLRLESAELWVQGQAHIDNWRDPQQLLDGSVNAVLPLASLAPLIPWKALGDQGPVLQDLLTGGGTLELEKTVIPPLELGRSPDWRALLSRLQAELSLSGLTLQPSPALPRITDVSGRLKLTDGGLSGHQLKARIGPLDLPNIQFEATPLAGATRIKASARGPLKLAPSEQPEVKTLLSDYRIKELALDSQIDLMAQVDLHQLDQWQATGHLTVADLELRTLHGGRVSGRGVVHLRRRTQLNLLISELTGRVNGSPYSISGSLYGLGAPDFLADLDVKLQGLELASLADLIPVLASTRARGRLSTDIGIYYLKQKPANTRIQGAVAVRNLGLQLADGRFQLSQINGQAKLSNSRIELENLTARVNDQALSAHGKISNLSTPSLELALSSPSLDLDRWLPAPEAQPEATESQVSTAPADSDPLTLPDIVKRSRALIDISIKQGRYRDVDVKNLRFETRYKSSKIDSFRLALDIADGHLNASGSADLSDLAAIDFKFQHEATDLALKRVRQLLPVEQEGATGSISSSGHLQANSRNLIDTMSGQLSLQAGPGRIPERSPFAKSLFSILSIVNVQGILKGDFGAGLAVNGLPYDSLIIESDIEPGQLDFSNIELITPAFSTRAVGTVDLQNEQISMDAVITVLGTVDAVLGFVPLLGESVADLAKVYLRIGGPLTKPSVRVQPAEGLTASARSILKIPLSVLPPAPQ